MTLKHWKVYWGIEMSYDDANNKCPYYKRYKKLSIVCEGVTGRSNIELSFFDQKNKKEYVEKMCRGNYQSCMICQMLNEKYQ